MLNPVSELAEMEKKELADDTLYTFSLLQCNSKFDWHTIVFYEGTRAHEENRVRTESKFECKITFIGNDFGRLTCNSKVVSTPPRTCSHLSRQLTSDLARESIWLNVFATYDRLFLFAIYAYRLLFTNIVHLDTYVPLFLSLGYCAMRI